MNLLVEIGNTALKAVWTEGIILGKTVRYQGEKVIDYILSLTEKEKPEVLTVASMREIGVEDRELLAGCCGSLLVCDCNGSDLPYPEGFPEYLGCSRVASLFAAAYLFKGKACSVFDFGTTLKTDFMDMEGRYLGGNISPGCTTRFKSLHRYTRTLPELRMAENVPEKGDSVEDSIQAGVIKGIMFEIDGYAGQYPDNVMIFTGGDAAYFAGKAKHPVFVVSSLVMMGLALMTNEYVKKNIH